MKNSSSLNVSSGMDMPPPSLHRNVPTTHSIYSTAKFDPAKPIIFQDVDGVLNNDFTDRDDSPIDDSLVDRLRRGILDRLPKTPGVQIVLSSQWRKFDRNLDLLKRAFDKQGISAENGYFVVDATPSLCRGVECRAEEIHQWLEAHGYNKEDDAAAAVSSRSSTGSAGPNKKWVILDDWNLDEQKSGDSPLIHDHFVRTDARVGLSDANADNALELLGGTRIRASGGLQGLAFF